MDSGEFIPVYGYTPCITLVWSLIQTVGKIVTVVEQYSSVCVAQRTSSKVQHTSTKPDQTTARDRTTHTSTSKTKACLEN